MSSVSPVISAADLLTARAAGAEIVVLEVRRDRTDLPAGAALTDPAPAGHLPGAHAADFTDFVGARTRDSGNGPLPSHDQVADLVRRWGIHDGSLVVVYSPDARPARPARGGSCGGRASPTSATSTAASRPGSPQAANSPTPDRPKAAAPPGSPSAHSPPSTPNPPP